MIITACIGATEQHQAQTIALRARQCRRSVDRAPEVVLELRGLEVPPTLDGVRVVGSVAGERRDACSLGSDGRGQQEGPPSGIRETAPSDERTCY